MLSGDANLTEFAGKAMATDRFDVQMPGIVECTLTLENIECVTFQEETNVEVAWKS